MLLFLKTVRGVCIFCKQLTLEYTKLIKVGIFWKLDTLDSYPVHFGIIQSLVTSVPSLSMPHNFRPFACSSIVN